MGIDLLAYAIMGNHVHLVVRLRPETVAAWDAREVARRALAVLPIRSGPALEPLTVTPAMVNRYAGNARWVAQQRKRLSTPSWLLRLVKQEVSRRANAEDGCTGHFWEKRFTSVAVLDAAATVACMIYVDLNPLRAGMVKTPELSTFTSVRHRVARLRAGTRSDREAPDSELGTLLVAMPNCAPPHLWTGEEERWALGEGDYLEMLEETARQVVAGKRGAMTAASLPMLQRLGISPVAWLNAMATGGSMLGSALGGLEARQRWADSRRQKWAADKSGLWE
jgi:REP element-mobilizing transposase RayT